MLVDGTSLLELSMAAALAGSVHTLVGADHWAPLAAFARLEAWSVRRAATLTLLCGVAHCALGFAVLVAASWMPVQTSLNGVGQWVLAGVGAALLVQALRSMRRPNADLPRTAALRWSWLLLFVLGPCEWLWPTGLAALDAHGLGGALFVSLAFMAATLTAMLGAVLVVLLGWQRLRLPQPVLHAAAGLVMLGSAALM